jgi:23S rRNA pseudouridine1911/1915/1917 synthase
MESVAVVYEDEAVAVLHKPAGLLTHPDGRSREATLSDWVAERYPEAASVGEEALVARGARIARPGIVHRLDRETSGLVVIARTREAFAHLKQAFQGRAVEKIYHAFVYGVPSPRAGSIAFPIGRSARDFRRFAAEPLAGRRAGGERRTRGALREALTGYAVKAENGEYAFLEIRPRTGRTHQIRVHLASVGHPVVCDGRYAPRHPCALGFSRLALHASSLSFALPGGTRLVAEAPLPEDFAEALTRLKRDTGNRGAG